MNWKVREWTRISKNVGIITSLYLNLSTKKDKQNVVKRFTIKEVVVTNTIPLDMDKMPDKIVQLNVGTLLGKAIARIHDDESVSSLFEYANKWLILLTILK